MSCLNLNKVVLAGRLTADPELKQTPSGVAVLSFSIAINRRYVSKNNEQSEAQTDFINVVAWRQTAEFISKYFSKGRMIVVDGRLEMRDWTDKEGNKRTSAEINVANAYFGDSKRDGEGASSYGNSNSGYTGNPAPAPSYGGGYSAPAAAPASDFAMLEDDDAQLPF